MTNFSTIQLDILQLIRCHPKGLKQADIATHLGIPRAVDNNWITYYILKNMVQTGLLIRNDQKTFLLA